MFPVPPGILDYAGINTLGVVVWAQDEGGAEAGVELKSEGVLEGGIYGGLRDIGKDLRPEWSDRSEYY